MTTVKLKIKINNSYESEPSSGSGSSSINDPENGDRKYSNAHIKHDPNLYSAAISASEDEKHSLSQIIYEPIQNSSQESNFEGFDDNQINDRSFSTSLKKKAKEEQPLKSFTINVMKIKKSPENKHHQKSTKFYDDILIEQNSCNAVDMQLSNKDYFANSEMQQSNPEKISTELTFNGKINNLTVNSQIVDDFKHPKIVNSSFDMNNSQFNKYDKSPDLFDEDDDDDNDDSGEEEAHSFNENEGVESKPSEEPINKSLNCPTESSFAEENIETPADEITNHLCNNIKKEKEILKRIKTCLSGIPPPPSLTIPQLDLFTAIANNKNEILNYKTEIETVASIIVCDEESLFKPSHPLEEVYDMPWKEKLGVRGHGLCYNICKASESIELLSLAVIERYIGAETSTSYTANVTTSPSSAKKRNLRQKMLTQTTGCNRLSHLARRRAVFSSANLSTTLFKPQNCLTGMQILLDNKKKGKSRRKGTTPKRMTPASKKKIGRKTPSSSARKRLSFRLDVAKPGPSRETSRRALFQSPAKQQKTHPVAPKPSLKPEIANRVEKSKRALFSPDKPPQSLSKISILQNTQSSAFGKASQSSFFDGVNLDFPGLKRKRSDYDEDDLDSTIQQTKKVSRHETSNLTPRSLKIKSQSFCVGTGSTNIISSSNKGSIYKIPSNSSINTSITAQSSSRSSNGRPITKAFSDTTFNSSNLLTENHRKKLLWAVSQALQSKQINASHVNFKQYASVLARVVKRLFQEFSVKANSSTSDTMLRLAKNYVYNVIQGKTADEIYIYAKSKIEEERKISSTRLSGYIAPEEFEIRKLSLTQSSVCSFENTIDSFALSQSSAHNVKNCDEILMESSSKSAIKLGIQPNMNLQKSSSKNNVDGMALRENFDCEQRNSAQKIFNGIDQQNVSPYANPAMRSTSNHSISLKSSLYDVNSNTAKARRQISFDSL